ncbi:hypothetical protein PCC6912_31420 [Chlorogloeopsis fritschii PCC 6912]|uniref:DUF1772 domain-containing protein n=1 Tax=Chlorogloeopsis fritschii PCC 6912 TaxID=211165 RepID=A0A433NCB6_CHLFR|nr:DUF1772 domain-containing protein [Chlorogloeopsis fritschii]RUR79606.1 hypothetical protein PCC6912_31420 [Chlorogloeopsis fritschii PCC 6912]
MLVRTWRFITITLVALSMGMAWCHALELPAKMGYDSSLWVTLHQTLYVAFGPPNIGAFVEVGALLAAIVLTFLVRKRRTAFRFTLLGTICLVIAFPVIFFAFTEPVNAQVRQWTVDTIPADWMRWRDQWEYSHAARFVFQLIGFCALLLSVLVETPKNRPLIKAPTERQREGVA